MNNPKTFATKGVQTDSLDYVPASKSKKNLHVSSQTNTLLNRSASSQSSDTSSALCSLGDLEVYTYPNASFRDYPRHISDCPPITPHRVRNYGQLRSSKPSHMASIDRRIASLPETSPPYRVSQLQGTVRLASMPEQLRALRSSDDSKQYLDYAENLKLSPNSNPRSGSSGIGHTVFSRVPRTPSPLESPELVMIVRNDDNVPRALLHRRSHVGIENGGGWITQEGSPPKPIPALHGPLSLPYARCPSGAEGIIVENEDLSHMVWGLDSNSSHQTQAKSQSIGIHGHKTIPRNMPIRPLNPVPQNSDGAVRVLRNQNGIDFSRPEPHLSLSKGEASSRTDLGYFEDQQRFQNSARNEKGGFYELVRRDSPIQLYPTSFGLPSSDNNSRKAGLGIDLWRGIQENNTFLQPDPVGGRTVYRVQTYDEHRQQSEIPTPPDTDPSRWSPLFHPTFVASAPIVQRAQVQPSHQVNSPQLQPAKLRLPPPPTHKAQERAFLPMAPVHRPVAGLAGPSDRNHMMASPWVQGASLPNDHSLKFEGQNNLTQSLFQLCSIRNEPIPPVSDSPDLGQNFTQRQPRSIPLVRLIQRRLSSVVEEGVGADKSIRTEPSETVLTALNQALDRSSPRLNNLPASERTRPPGLTANIIPSLSSGSSTGNLKQVYEASSHPSRRYEGGARNAGDNIQKTAGTISAPTNELRGGAENTGIPKKINMKQKKSYRKKKHAL